MGYMSEARVRYLWRTKYPWLIFMYIVVIGILRGVVATSDPQLAMNLLMASAFTSYVFLYVFYIFGVRPVELEYHFRKHHGVKAQMKMLGLGLLVTLGLVAVFWI